MAEARRTQGMMEMEVRERELDVEAVGHEKLLEAYGQQPQLAMFMEGNKSELWAKQAEQQAAAVQNLSPEYHIFQSGTESGGAQDPIMNLIQRYLPMVELLGNKYGAGTGATASQKD